MSRIDEFNRACAAIFSTLYEAFPVPIPIDPVSVGFIDERQQESEPRLVFSATMMFLADEKYIQYERATDSMHQKQEARLTALGLARLQKIPGGIQPQTKTLIEQLREAGVSIGGQVSGSATSQTVTQVLRLVFE